MAVSMYGRNVSVRTPHAEASRLIETDTVTAGSASEPLHTARLEPLAYPGDTLAEAGIEGRTASSSLKPPAAGSRPPSNWSSSWVEGRSSSTARRSISATWTECTGG